MTGIESAVEALQETDTPAEIDHFLENNLECIVDYVQLTTYKEGHKSRKIAILDYLKTILSNRSIAPRLCTEKYVFGLQSIRVHASTKKVPDGIVYMCYEIYSETVKILLEDIPEEFLGIVYRHPNICYIEQLIKSAECNSIVEMLPCFFSLNGNNFEKWIDMLVSKSIISMIFKYFNKPGKPHKDTQNLSKILYLFVSFTGNLFRDSENMKSTHIHYAFFYREIEKRTHCLLNTVFMGSDSINRLSALEVIRCMISANEFLLPNESSFFRFLSRYFIHSDVLKCLIEGDHSPAATVRIIHMINTLSATVRYKSIHTLNFLNASGCLGHIAVYLHSTSTHTVTNEICYFLNELIYVDKVFYIDPIILFCQKVKEYTLKRVVQLYAHSQKKHSPHVSISDCITPVIYILYKLYYLCLYDTTNRNRETKTQSKRFIVIDEGIDSYKILQQLEFLQEEHAYWYITTRVVDHERRISLEYSWSLPERPPNAEQFARYFCEYTASILPAYPPWLFR